jgi:hypothetical protein
MYKVVVVVEKEQDNGKIKNVKETYIVEDAGSPEEASKKISIEMKDCIFNWFINSITLIKITKIV